MNHNRLKTYWIASSTVPAGTLFLTVFAVIPHIARKLTFVTEVTITTAARACGRVHKCRLVLYTDRFVSAL